MNDTDKLNQIRAILGGHPGAAYETPELFPNQIAPATMDGTTVQRDGSTWTIAVGSGLPEQIVYGYFNRAKDPAMWDAMAAIMGEDRLVAAMGTDPWKRIRANPRGVLNTGKANAINLASLVNNLLPAYKQ